MVATNLRLTISDVQVYEEVRAAVQTELEIEQLLS